LTFFLHRQMNHIQAAVLVFDAAGLAVFCVAGAAKALTYGIGPVQAVALGAISAVGGGIIRDVLANEQPAVLRADSELYALPAVLGATIVALAQHAGLYGPLIAGVAVALVFALRVAALRYGWRAPKPRRPVGARDEP
ncbi:MAG: trimeric intracellular cation channel family protein, partial [Ktedonobacterales bacterium]